MTQIYCLTNKKFLNLNLDQISPVVNVVFGNKYFISNYEIINEEFESDKVWIVIFKFLTLTILKTMMELNSNPNLKIIDLPNNKFEQILNFQMKSLFPNMILEFKNDYPNLVILKFFIYNFIIEIHNLK